MTKKLATLLIIMPVLLFAQADSFSVLSYEDFISLVQNEHPIARQADLQIRAGEAGLLRARGAFDPKITGDWNQKHFLDKQYYNLGNAIFKVPTWFGIELLGGYEQNQGIFLNPENNTPSSGLLYAGISIPLGQDLLIDKRRAELKKAKIYLNASQMERLILLNELILEAGTAYWKWFESYNILKIYEEAVRLATERYEAVKYGAQLGEFSHMDTVEAAIQMQNRILGYENARLKFQNASASLSVYLWANGLIPLELAEGTIPPAAKSTETRYPDSLLILLKDSLLFNHPEINKTRLTIEQLEIINRLKKNQMLPDLRLKYNPLTEYNGLESLAALSLNGYTWGLQFRMPLFLRKERGELQLSNLELQQQQLHLNNKQAQINYKFTAAWNLWHTTKIQADLYAQTVQNAEQLLKNEQTLFNAGESSLFMINSRENSYIKTRQELVKLITKNRLAELQVAYTLGLLAKKD